jgi:hypothetical protein
MFARFTISSVLKSIAITAAAAVGLVGAPEVSDAHTIGARSGKEAAVASSGCWSPFGPSVTNTCTAAQFWNIQLLDPPCGVFGCGTVTVTVQAARFGSDVACRTIGWSKGGTMFQSTAFKTPVLLGVPDDINLSVSVPSGGTQDIDCLVSKDSKLITVTY